MFWMKSSSKSDRLSKSAPIHLKIDTGMSRIGVSSPEEAVILAYKAISDPNVYLEGVYTHFAAADNEDTTFTYTQFQRFQSVIKYLENKNISVPIKHCCNSAATMKFPDMHLDMVRIGVGLYGLYPDVSLKNHPIQLRQAMSFKTKIAALKKFLPPSRLAMAVPGIQIEKVSLLRCHLDMQTDFPTTYQTGGKVLIHGQKSAIAGRVWMD